MPDLPAFSRLFDYDYWANKETLQSLKTTGSPPPKALGIFAHVLAAEQVWHARLNHRYNRKMPIWPAYPLAACESLVEELYRYWGRYLAALSGEELSRELVYRNSQGMVFRTVTVDILAQVIIHGGYHRGQIALLLREAGQQPAVTDFIAFTRR